MSDLRTAAYVLCIVPWIIFPSCFGQFGTPNPYAMINDSMAAFVILVIATPIIVIFDLVVAAKSPAKRRIGPWTAAIAAAIPLLYLIVQIGRSSN